MTPSTKKPKPIKKPKDRERIVSHEDCLNCRCLPHEQCSGVKSVEPDDGFGDYGVKINGSQVISRTGSR